MADYQVKKKRTKSKEFLPGSEEFYVEFIEFDRLGRDEYNRDRLVGGATLVDTMLHQGIFDFLLPGDTGSHKHTGDADVDQTVYRDLTEDLEDWCIQGVARVNGLKRPDGSLLAPPQEGGPGNSPGSPEERSEEPAPAASDDATQPPPPS